MILDRFHSLRQPLGALLLLFLAAPALPACSSRSLYELPPPPPEKERKTISLIPGEEARQAERDYLQARSAVIQLNAYLRSKRFEESLGLMSQETQAMLEFLSPSPKAKQPALATLIEGKINVRGQLRDVDPAAMLLASDLTQIKDSVDGKEEQETQRRKELFALQPDGSIRKIVMIKEGGQWVLHKTNLDQLEEK